MTGPDMFVDMGKHFLRGIPPDFLAGFEDEEQMSERITRLFDAEETVGVELGLGLPFGFGDDVCSAVFDDLQKPYGDG